MEIANSKKRFVYLLHMNFMKQDFYKIGVFTGYVASRISKILDDIDHIVPITCVRKWQLEGMTNHFGIPVKKNYQVELNAQHYLRKHNVNFWFPPFSKMGGKTEWFTGVSEKQCISAVMSAIRWHESNPAKITNESVITKEGFITKYRYGKKPNYSKVGK